MAHMVSRHLLVTAADAVAQAVERLQWAQQTPWQSVAADAMRAELYAAIQLLRTVGDSIAEAERSVDRVRAEVCEWEVAG